MQSFLKIEHLSVSIEDKSILHDFNLVIEPGTIHAIMGPNGSGKSTLAYTLMGHPRYQITDGIIIFKGQHLNQLSADKRAKLGLFLVFQYPYEIPGVSIKTFLKESYQAIAGSPISVTDFEQLLTEKMQLLSIDASFANRYLNDGFSGGEKKRLELLQVLLLKPSLVIFDEIDSGLDVDALRMMTNALKILKEECPRISYLIITHYNRIFNYIVPDMVHILDNGHIVQSSGAQLAIEIEKNGYSYIK